MRGGNKAFADFLDIRRIPIACGDPKKMHKKYYNAELLYYREVLQAKIENRTPAPFEASFWDSVVSPLKQGSSNPW